MYSALYVSQPRRFEFDEFISEAECTTLLETARAHSVSGDGYSGTVSPHTIHEIYGGLTLNRIRHLLNEEALERRPVELLIEVSKKIKRVVERRFAVTKRLHFGFTHLVCRTAIKGLQDNRKDLSHGVHADNCNIHPDGSCPKKAPAFTWRDFTAILYLNNEFTGGEFFFAGDFHGRAIDRVVRPTCGKLVAFTSGRENLHGVKAVRNGTRCALAIWFTYDRKKFENERMLLYKYNNIKVY